MPRFGKQFKVYNRILPSLILDVTDIIEDCKLKKKKIEASNLGKRRGLQKMLRD
jgi:hypothetical protein